MVVDHAEDGLAVVERQLGDALETAPEAEVFARGDGGLAGRAVASDEDVGGDAEGVGHAREKLGAGRAALDLVVGDHPSATGRRCDRARAG